MSRTKSDNYRIQIPKPGTSGRRKEAGCSKKEIGGSEQRTMNHERFMNNDLRFYSRMTMSDNCFLFFTNNY